MDINKPCKALREGIKSEAIENYGDIHESSLNCMLLGELSALVILMSLELHPDNHMVRHVDKIIKKGLMNS